MPFPSSGRSPGSAWTDAQKLQTRCRLLARRHRGTQLLAQVNHPSWEKTRAGEVGEARTARDDSTICQSDSLFREFLRGGLQPVRIKVVVIEVGLDHVVIIAIVFDFLSSIVV